MTLIEPLLLWAFPASVSALAWVLWWGYRRMDRKLDEIGERLNTLDKFIATELRTLDVRITRLESYAWPRQHTGK